MAQQQIFRQPSPRRRDDEPADDQYAPQYNYGRGKKLSEDAGATLGNIDDVLREQEANAPLATGGSRPRGGISQGDARAARNRRAGVGNRQAARRDPANRSASVLDGSNDLADQEKAAADDTVGNGYTGGKDASASKEQNAATGTQNAKGMRGLLKQLAKRKAAVAGVAGMGAGAVGGLIAILILASSLGIPNLAHDIGSYMLARMGRQAAASIMRTTDEAAAVETTNDTLYSKLKAKYTSTVQPVKDTWSKLDKYRPSKVMANMIGSEDLTFNYGKSDLLGRPVLTSVTLKGKEFPIKIQDRSFVARLNPLIQFSEGVNYSRDFAPALDAALRADDIGPIIRGSVAKQLRQKLGISLLAWNLAKFKGKNAEAAQIEETQERVKKVDGPTKTAVNDATTEAVKDGVDAARQAEEQTAESAGDTKAAIKAGGIVSSVQKALASAVEFTNVDKALAVANPIYGAAMNICIVYDGSMEHSGPIVDQQSAQQQGAYYYVASAADQLKYGTKDASPVTATELASAANATNTSLSDTTSSNAIVRASGYSPDTANTVSAQQSAGGEFTLLNAIMPSAAANTINAVADKLCPIFTNTGVAIGGAVVNIVAAIATLGESEAAVEGAGVASEQVVGDVSASLAENLITKYIGKTAGRITGILYDTGKGTVKGAIRVAAITVLAKLVVSSRAGQTFSGFSMGNDLANEADAGGNIVGNELERTQLFGRPMLMDEVCASNQDDRSYVAANFSRQSTYDRYLNVHEPDSLISRTAIMVNSNMNGSIARGLVNFGQSILQPLHSFGTLANMLTGLSHAAVNCNSDASSYGNVQFGWSREEEALVNSNDSYKPLENQQILDDSGKADEIAKKYANCFGYDYNPDGTGPMDPTATDSKMKLATGIGEAGSIGTLLSSGAIIRDGNGNVINSGLCSPQNLGFHSTDALASDGESPSAPQDLILRWRLAMQYDNTLNQLNNLQDVTNT